MKLNKLSNILFSFSLVHVSVVVPTFGSLFSSSHNETESSSSDVEEYKYNPSPFTDSERNFQIVRHSNQSYTSYYKGSYPGIEQNAIIHTESVKKLIARCYLLGISAPLIAAPVELILLILYPNDKDGLLAVLTLLGISSFTSICSACGLCIALRNAKKRLIEKTPQKIIDLLLEHEP